LRRAEPANIDLRSTIIQTTPGMCHIGGGGEFRRRLSAVL
jgi:hypothetical protein